MAYVQVKKIGQFLCINDITQLYLTHEQNWAFENAREKYV